MECRHTRRWVDRGQICPACKGCHMKCQHCCVGSSQGSCAPGFVKQRKASSGHHCPPNTNASSPTLCVGTKKSPKPPKALRPQQRLRAHHPDLSSQVQSSLERNMCTGVLLTVPRGFPGKGQNRSACALWTGPWPTSQGWLMGCSSVGQPCRPKWPSGNHMGCRDRDQTPGQLCARQAPSPCTLTPAHQP